LIADSVVGRLRRDGRTVRATHAIRRAGTHGAIRSWKALRKMIHDIQVEAHVFRDGTKLVTVHQAHQVRIMIPGEIITADGDPCSQ